MAFRLPPWARLGIIVRDAPDFTRYVIARYRKDRASGMAASLAYTSLLSLVPLMAIKQSPVLTLRESSCS